MTSYHALLATAITTVACLLLSVVVRVLMRVSHRSGGRKDGMESGKIISLSSAISAVVITLEGELTNGFPGEVAATFFFIATSTGLFAIGAAIAAMYDRLSGRPDTLETQIGIRTGIAFGDAMILIASIIAFAQITSS